MRDDWSITSRSNSNVKHTFQAPHAMNTEDNKEEDAFSLMLMLVFNNNNNNDNNNNNNNNNNIRAVLRIIIN